MPAATDPSTPRTAGVIPPPVLFFAALALGFALHRLWPQPLFADATAGRVAGVALIALGAALGTWMMLHFRRAGTPVSPLRPTRRLVVSGPYRYSRNPDYIGQALICAGIALAANAAWALLMLPPALLLVRHAVVAREERYLLALFGEPYAAYCRRVRRWI
ncbi:hypothetical protein MBSD_n0864 [Mizugakiibacter sediminis]|uniref:Protein-S-isoprenylcysteine methyltransferase n=1 Tax=Mizugakiibacter sediminis TaxID=1475481 RepID=A0A0K8QL34_9GAMM|nr:hypothetical protein MBSD_n0864 [Mizugakiibacter sediminis]